MTNFQIKLAIPMLGRVTAAFLLGNAAVLLATNSGFAQSCPLGAANPFAVLGGAAVTNTNPTILVGDLGVSPGTSITGLSSVTLTGTVHQTDAVAALAQADIATQYQALAGLPPSANLSGFDLGGMTLTPGVYRFDTSAQLTGTLTLNTLGDPQAVFVFQIGSTLTTATNSRVNVIGGPDGQIFWQIGSSATLGTGTIFAGNILALASVTLTTGASLQCGSAFAQSGAVTMDSNLVVSCSAGTACSIPGTPTVAPTVTPTVLPTGTPSATHTPVGGPTPVGTATRTATPTPTVLIPPGCIAIPPSVEISKGATKVYNDVSVIAERQVSFAQKAARCGRQRFKSTTVSRLLNQIQLMLNTDFTTAQLSCPGVVCESEQTTEVKRELTELVKRVSVEQVKAKVGAIVACRVRDHVNENPTGPVKNSTYYYNRAVTSINGLPLVHFMCR